ncbi:hypothetical protein CWI36_3417p0010, partial [Hamiltosporidium magnivora]
LEGVSNSIGRLEGFRDTGLEGVSDSTHTYRGVISTTDTYRGVITTNNTYSDSTDNTPNTLTIPFINSSAYANEQGYGRVTIGSNVLRITRSNTNRKITTNKIEKDRTEDTINNTSHDSISSSNKDSSRGNSNNTLINNSNKTLINNTPSIIPINNTYHNSNIINTPSNIPINNTYHNSNIINTPSIIPSNNTIPSYMDRTQSFIRNTNNINTYINKYYNIHNIYLSEQITLLHLNEISVEECCERICKKLGEKEFIRFFEGVICYIKDDVKGCVLKYVSCIKDRVLFPRFSNLKGDSSRGMLEGVNNKVGNIKGDSSRGMLEGVNNRGMLEGVSNKVSNIKGVSTSSRDSSLKGFN